MFWKKQPGGELPPPLPQSPAASQPVDPQQALLQQVIREAEFCRQKMEEGTQLEMSYNPVCMMQIDSFIGDLLKDGPAEQPNMLIILFGSYFGECLRRCYGGQWALDERGVRCLRGIAGSDIVAYPYNTVRDSIVGREPAKVFYTASLISKMVFERVGKAFYPEQFGSEPTHP